MKRIIIFLLLSAICVGMVGCSEAADTMKRNVNFYYLSDPVTYEGENGLTAPESREVTGSAGDQLQVWLDIYFEGPKSKGFQSPFPENVKTLKVSQDRRILKVLLSSEFLVLKDLELTIACTCIARTLFELTGYNTVEISAPKPFHDGRTSIIVNKDSFVFMDAIL